MMLVRFQDLSPREKRRLIKEIRAYNDPKFHFPIWDGLCVAWALYLAVWAVLAVFGVVGSVTKFLTMALALSLLFGWAADLWDSIERERIRANKVAERNKAVQR